VGVGPTMADLQSAALATWLRRPVKRLNSCPSSKFCADSSSLRRGDVPPTLPGILCTSPASVNHARIEWSKTPPRIIDLRPTFSLTFMPALPLARQRRHHKPPSSGVKQRRLSGCLQPPALAAPPGREPLRDRDSAAAPGGNTPAPKPGCQVAGRLGPCSWRRRNDTD
jgi:hypothetical protein